MPVRASPSKLRAPRLKRGWSQEAVGQKLGVTGAAIGHYETGLSKPPPARAAHLARILGLRPGYVQASAHRARTARVRDAGRDGGRKASTRSSGGVGVTDPHEIAVIEALRSMPSAGRRVVMNMVIAYGSAGVSAPRKRRG
jgi:transcriptional regulator with XRE-family HTH domain